ncbi:MAG: pantoate--beta-alanine ligase [Chromatiales bacterium]|nr:pantoate--beta-alanine ligase [Gammaproteobacteria bacterium]MBW6476112.1 pantoate--beta-alanine ligase [Chromatiales bacterium]
MLVCAETAPLRQQLAAWRRAGDRIAFVPTMGNLHAGHLRLVEVARQQAERVVVSIFVNPLQFAAGEDLAAYPRTPAEDASALELAGVDLLFLPAEELIYPHGRKAICRVTVPPELGEILCGASRPGHFDGVATVVCKLFNLVQPDLACLGRKDYQQLRVLQRMVRDLNIPVRLLGVDTVREADGLAMSSRNAYLTPEQRQQAPALYRTLQRLAGRLQAGEQDFAALQAEGMRLLEEAGLRPDYVSIRCRGDLRPAVTGDTELVILAAAYLGRARLIDNLRLALSGG